MAGSAALLDAVGDRQSGERDVQVGFDSVADAWNTERLRGQA